MEEKVPFQGLGEFGGRLIALLGVYCCAFAYDGGEKASVVCRQQSFQGHAQGVEVAPGIGLAVAVLLRRGIAAGAEMGGVLICFIIGEAGGIEVYEADLPGFLFQQVGRLDVPVDDAPAVQEAESLGQVQQQVCGFFFGQFPVGSQLVEGGS